MEAPLREARGTAARFPLWFKMKESVGLAAEETLRMEPAWHVAFKEWNPGAAAEVLSVAASWALRQPAANSRVAPSEWVRGLMAGAAVDGAAARVLAARAAETSAADEGGTGASIREHFPDSFIPGSSSL